MEPIAHGRNHSDENWLRFQATTFFLFDAERSRCRLYRLTSPSFISLGKMFALWAWETCESELSEQWMSVDVLHCSQASIWSYYGEAILR